MSFFEEYFENIARKQASIKHEVDGNKCFFFIEDWDKPDEVIKSAGRQVGEYILVLEDFEDSLSDNDRDNNTEELFSAFAVLQFVSDKRGDAKTAKDNCRAIARSVVHKLKKDGFNGILTENQIICKMNSRGFAVGPVMQNYYGWRYSFSWKGPHNIAIVADEWLP